MMSNAMAAETSPTYARDADLKPLYLEALTLVEHLHRRLLDVVKHEFERTGVSDINSVQALLLFNIGESKIPASDLRARGYYLGTNVSYNLKKLAQLDYINHERASHDRRSVRISLTERGNAVADVVNRLYERHVIWIDRAGGIAAKDFNNIRYSLRRLERFLGDQILYRL